MRRAILIAWCMIISTVMLAQGITVRTFSFSPTDLEAKINPVPDANGAPTALIRVSSNSTSISFSGNIIGDPTFSNGEWMIYVPAGTRFLKLSSEGAYSLNYEFPVTIQASCCYEMSIRVEDKDSIRTLMMPSVGSGSFQPSYGLMTGAMFQRYGIYLRARSDFNKEPSCSYTCDDNGLLENGEMGWYVGESASSRFSMTAGGMRRLSPLLTAYAGLGYGSRTLAWQTYDGQYAKVSTRSFRGVETEVGFILTLGPVAVAVGADLCGLKGCEGVIGIGLMF